MTTMYNPLRNAHLGLIHDVLLQQDARKIDLVAPAADLQMLAADDGQVSLFITTEEQHVGEDGVTQIVGAYGPTDIFDEGVSDKLDIPIRYLRRMREQHQFLYAANINGWLEKNPSRKFLVRLFKGQQSGVARALLSDRFRVLDNLDFLMATLDAIRSTGMEVNVRSADLSERRMTVRLVCPEVEALAPTLLRGYRNPFTGQTGEDNPGVWAGIRISNSETGGGAFTIAPEFLVQVCTNGMTVTKDAIREVHLGGRLEEGPVKWSDETQQRSLELVKAKTIDAVTTFLDVDYMKSVIAKAEEKADEKIEKPTEAVKDVTKEAGFTEAQQEDILGYFIQSGQMTLGGIYNAATLYAQTVEDPDEAHLVDMRAAAILGL